MLSIAIFPCSHTNGASIVGELINSLHQSVYTDEMLFSDVSEQFGIPVEKVKKVICGQLPATHRHMLKKKKYINCLRCTLEAQTMYSHNSLLHYGLHTSLLDFKKERILKVLVFDDEENRVKRAMQQEGFTEKVARDHVQRHDQKVFDWTSFLFHRQAYDRSLYDLMISLKDKNLLDITSDIIVQFQDIKSSQSPFQAYATLPVLENPLSMLW